MLQRIIIFYFFLMIFSNISIGQTYEEVKEKIDNLSAASQFDSVIYYGNILANLAEESGDTIKMIYSYELLSNYFQIKQEIKNAEKYVLLALKLAKKNVEDEHFIRILLHAANVYEYLDLEKSEAFYSQAEEMVNQTDHI